MAIKFRNRDHAPALDLDRAQMDRLLDEQARRYLNMSGAEFIAAVERGEVPEHPVTAHLLLLSGAEVRRKS